MASSRNNPRKKALVRDRDSGEKTKAVGNSKRGNLYVSYSAVDKMALAKKGVSKKQLNDIKDEASLDYDQLSKILATSRSSLISKKGTAKFNQDTSERILLLQDVITYGREVFGDREYKGIKQYKSSKNYVPKPDKNNCRIQKEKA